MKVSLLMKMVLLILVPVILGMACLGGISGYFAGSAMHDERDSAMTQLAARQAGELENMAILMGEAMKTLAGDDRVPALLEAAAGGMPEAELAALRAPVDRLIENLRASFAFMDQIGLTLPDGLIIAHITPRSVGTKRAYASPDGEPFVINTRTGTKKVMSAVFTVPVVRDGRVLGHVYTTTAMKDLAARTLGKLRLYETGAVCVYDRKGILQMHSDAARQGEDQSDRPWVREMLSRESGRLDYSTPEGDHMLYFTTLQRQGWTVALDVPTREAEAGLRTMLAIIAGFSLVFLLGGVISLSLISRDIAGAVRDLTGFARHAAGGSLEFSPEQRRMLEKHGRRVDEMGELSTSIVTMMGNMSDMVRHADQKTAEAESAAGRAQEAMQHAEHSSQAAERALEAQVAAARRLEQVVESMTSALARLSAQAEHSLEAATAQADRVSATATAMDGMNTSVMEVARNAGEAARVSDEARSKAQEGAGIVQQVIGGMERVDRIARGLSADMAELNGKATAISSILDVISDIADQTNLLALNAAIEAARAGEAGRGFAVVADEVRKLAEKTMHATAEVGQAIQGIQQGATKNVSSMETASATVGEVSDMAAQSGRTLDEIVSLVDLASDQVKAIAMAGEEQSATSDDVNKAMEDINRLASEMAEAMGMAEQAIQELSGEANSLEGLIREMERMPDLHG